MCAKCGSRKGTVDWVGGMGIMGLTHGMSVPWCLICVTEAQLEYAQQGAAAIPGLSQKLLALAEYEQEHGSLDGWVE